MKDLTQGPVSGHIIAMSLPIAVGLLMQTLYFMVDLYFVGGLGDVALAGTSSAGTLFFFIMALTQILNVGCATLISHAVGRKEQDTANALFNQSLFIALLCTLGFTLLCYAVAHPYFDLLAADEPTKATGLDYYYWFLPSLTLQFLIVVIGASLRGTGIVKPVMGIGMLALIVNIILTPMLISGWGLGIKMGVAGSGLASSIAAVVNLMLLFHYFRSHKRYLSIRPGLFIGPSTTLRKLLLVGFPSGAEFMLMFLYMGLVYWALTGFSAAAQAGFGVGSRVMQALFLPAMAIAFAAPAIAGQNFAAGEHKRVYETFKTTALMTCSLMLLLTLVCLWQPTLFISPFSDDPDVIGVAATFLSFIALNFVAAGFNFTTGAMFQGLANTWPSLLGTVTRVVSFAIPVIWLSGQPGFQIEQIWYCSVASIFLQALLNSLLLRREFARKLVPVAAD